MVQGNHWDQWFSNGFGVKQPLVTMVFDGCAPLVLRWNGYVPSSKSRSVVHQVSVPLSVEKAVLTLVSVTLGHPDDIDHLVLGEHLADRHLLPKVLNGKVDLEVFDKVQFMTM